MTLHLPPPFEENQNNAIGSLMLHMQRLGEIYIIIFFCSEKRIFRYVYIPIYTICKYYNVICNIYVFPSVLHKEQCCWSYYYPTTNI